MPEPTPPKHVQKFILALRAASRAARKAREAWYQVRDFYKIGVLTGNLASTTIAMWSADLHLEAMAANWRAVLAERLALPTAERWDLAALERWAVAQDEAGTP